MWQFVSPKASFLCPATYEPKYSQKSGLFLPLFLVETIMLSQEEHDVLSPSPNSSVLQNKDPIVKHSTIRIKMPLRTNHLRWDVTWRSKEYVSDHFTVTLAEGREEALAGTGKGVPARALEVPYCLHHFSRPRFWSTDILKPHLPILFNGSYLFHAGKEDFPNQLNFIHWFTVVASMDSVVYL